MIIETENIVTYFASPERKSKQEIAEEAKYILSHPLLRELLDSVSDIFLILNEKRQIVFANKTFLDLLKVDEVNLITGLRPGEALGCMHAYEMEAGCGTSEFCQTCGAARAILSSLRGKKSVQECRIIQYDGTALDLEVTATPFIFNGAHFSAFAVRDISDEKRRRVLERLFFHDILNVTGGIIGAVQLLHDMVPQDAGETRELVDWIHNFSLRLSDEIQNQRILVDAENNELTVKPAEVDSLLLLEEVVTLYQNHNVGHERHIHLKPEAQAVQMISDPRLLSRVLGNMVKNALEATPVGGMVSVTCRRDGHDIEFEVHNPGCMTRPVQLQLFQRSFSTKGKDRGLGTYSMKMLTERYLKGTIDFTTSPEHGTRFVVRYPVIGFMLVEE